MKKIPTLFLRDYKAKGNFGVTPEVTPGCEWVLKGEGVATRKFDGVCVRIQDGDVQKRHTVKEGGDIPEDFIPEEYDEVTGKTVGWVLVRKDDPNDRWCMEALAAVGCGCPRNSDIPDGTYELCGPRINGNPEGYDHHVLVAHGRHVIVGVPRDFEGLRAWLTTRPFEGIVWRHADGRMAKLKKRDFPRG